MVVSPVEVIEPEFITGTVRFESGAPAALAEVSIGGGSAIVGPDGVFALDAPDAPTSVWIRLSGIFGRADAGNRVHP